MNALPGVRLLWNWVQTRMGLNREHDLAIFNKLDAIANETRIDDILHYRIHASDLRSEDDHVLQDLIDALQRIENQYLDSVLRLRAEQLAWEMRKLVSFVGQTFWPVPSGRLKFRPDLIAEHIYKAEWKELNQKLEKAWEAYGNYRSSIKVRLRCSHSKIP
jgi:hypothetical protein